MRSKCEEENKVNCNCIKPSINYQKCEELASKSKALYNQALGYNQKIEKYLAMAAQAKSKARELEEQIQAECEDKELEEQIQAAWWEYNEFIESSNLAACKGEALMKASCKLLQQSQEYYSHLSSHNNVCNCNKQNQCNCGRD